MQFLTIHHSLNQVYNVEKRTIEQVTQKAISETKNIKERKVEVEISTTGSSASISVIIAKKATASYEDSVSKLYAKIEQYVENIVGTKAKNIRITVSENY